MLHLCRLAVIAAFLVLSQGAEPETAHEDDGSEPTPGVNFKFDDKCIDSFPSFKCDKKCKKLGKVAYCLDESDKCLCAEKDAFEFERTEADTDVPPARHGEPATANGKVVKMEDYCVFGQIPSVQCEAKCQRNNLESYCGVLSKACLCKQPGSVAAIPPAQESYCWFGEWPSTACYRRCLDNGGAFCVPHSLTNECRCKDEAPMTGTPATLQPSTQDTEAQTDETETQSEPPARHFLIFVNLGSLMGDGGEAEEGGEEDFSDGPEGAKAEAKGQSAPVRAEVKGQPAQEPEVKPAHAGAGSHGISRDQLWTLQTAAAFGIIAILFALLAIEVFSLYARKRSEKGLANVFNTLPTVAKS